jgi:hypothetical protein
LEFEERIKKNIDENYFDLDQDHLELVNEPLMIKIKG